MSVINVQSFDNKLYNIFVDKCNLSNQELYCSIASKLGVKSSDFYVLKNGKKIVELDDKEECILDEHKYHVIGRIVGGKGGFGSLLRSIGAQIEKTTNKEACRDLSGRRMRDVKNEQAIKEWMDKAEERKAEKLKRREEKYRKLRQGTNHKFDDQTYFQQNEHVREQLDDALEEGLKKITEAGATSITAPKRKLDEEITISKKSCPPWLQDSDESSSTDSDGDIIDSNTTSFLSSSPHKRHIEATSLGPPIELQNNNSVSSVKDITDDNVSLNANVKMDLNIIEKVNKDSFDDENDKNPKLGSQLENNVKDVVTTVGSTESEDVLKESFVTEDKSIENKEVLKETDTIQTNENTNVSVINRQLSNDNAAEYHDINLDIYNNSEELQCLGLDALKFALQSRGLKCGGTIQQRADRLFSVKGLKPEEIDRSLLAKVRQNSISKK